MFESSDRIEWTFYQMHAREILPRNDWSLYEKQKRSIFKSSFTHVQLID